MHGIQQISVNVGLTSPLLTLSLISSWQSFTADTLRTIVFHMESRSERNSGLFSFLPFNITSEPKLIFPYGLFSLKAEKQTFFLVVVVVLSVFHKPYLILSFNIFVMNFLVRILLCILPLKCASSPVLCAFLDNSPQNYTDFSKSHLLFFFWGDYL